MDQQRRQAVKAAGGVLAVALATVAGLIKPGRAEAAEWNKAAFETKGMAEVVKALGGAAPVESKDIELIVPEIAENGAVVPVTVNSKLPRTESISVLVDKNPNTLAAFFDIPQGTDPYITTRVKMAETSNLRALIKADGKYYYAAKEIKVTLGGCGG